jgi:hypothetical protein
VRAVEQSRPVRWRVDFARLAGPGEHLAALPWLRLTPARRASIGELLEELAREARATDEAIRRNLEARAAEGGRSS